jgi:hypothetical protein
MRYAATNHNQKEGLFLETVLKKEARLLESESAISY